MKLPGVRPGLRAAAFGLLFVLCLAGAAFGQGVPGSEKIIAVGGFQTLASQIGRNGSVRLIVKLDVPYQAMARPESPASRRQSDRIATVQDDLLASLAPFKITAFHKYGYIPYVFLKVDGPALEALLASPRVTAIFEDIPEFPTLDTSVPLIGAPSLWDFFGAGQGYDGAGVTVAILDTGVDKDHPFLNGAVVSEACYSTNDSAASSLSLCPGSVSHSTASDSALPYFSGLCPATKCDHGTHVAGIVAGRPDVAGSPGPGVAPGVNIIAIQVFSLIGGQVAAFQSDILKGLERVYSLRSLHDIAAVNLSLGGGQYAGFCDNDPRKPIIDSLKAAGVVTVAASGNNGYCGFTTAPACISSSVSVGATTDTDGVASFSNSASFLSVFAPGSSIVSSVPGAAYENKSGTSMAAPHLAGAWALIRQARPGDSVEEILTAFTSTGPLVTDAKCPAVAKRRILLDGIGGALEFLGGGPSAQTGPAGAIAGTTATLTGRVNANNSDAIVTFEYGTSTSYDHSVAASESPVSGSALTTVSANITGLTESTLYHFRVTAASAGGTSYGNEMTFTTAGPCPQVQDGGFESGSPSPAWTEASTNFGSPLCTVAVCGGAGPRAGAWWAWFGGVLGGPETGSLSQTIVLPPGSAPRLEFALWNDAASGNGVDFLSVTVDGEEIFSVREGDSLFSENYVLTGVDLSSFADGVVHSLDFFSSTTGVALTNFDLDDVAITCGNATTLPIAITDAASSIGPTAATLNGTLNANGAITTVWFEYGATTRYGNTVPAIPGSVAGEADTNVSAGINGLTPGETYHYRVAGANAAGIAYGGDRTFSNSCLPGDVRIGATVFGTVQAAVDNAQDGDIIKAKAMVFNENLSLPGGKTVTLQGGFDCAFVLNPGFTGITPSITVTGSGSVVMEKIAIE